MRTTPDITELLGPLDCTIWDSLVPAILGVDAISPQLRDLLALRTKDGGLGIRSLPEWASHYFEVSAIMSRPLINAIRENSPHLLTISPVELETSRVAAAAHHNAFCSSSYDHTVGALPDHLLAFRAQTACKGASAYLSASPKQSLGFNLNKSEFQDIMAMRYGFALTGLPRKCGCGAEFSVNHAQSCLLGGNVHMRHDTLRDLTITLLRDAFGDVEAEPLLQPVPGESQVERDGARPDGRARGFWRRGTNAYFDVRVTNLGSACYKDRDIPDVLALHEKAKKTKYCGRIQDFDYGTFTPLVFASSGAKGDEAKAFYKHLVSKIAKKRKQEYSSTAALVAIRLSFALQKAAVQCIRGPHLSKATRRVEEARLKADLADQAETFACIPADVILHDYTSANSHSETITS